MLLRWLAALLVLAPLIVRAAEPLTTIPYRIDYGGWFTVSATVNGQGPYDFIIDTGATQSLIFESLQAANVYPPSGRPPVEVLGLLGNAKFPTYTVGAIAVGPAQLDNLVTVILPDWKVGTRSPHGVLGLDFLTLYTLDFNLRDRRLLVYGAGDKPSAKSDFKRIPTTRSNFGRQGGTLHTVDARINRRPIRMLLDLGASGTIVNRAGLDHIGQTQGTRVRFAVGSDSGRIKDALEKATPARIVLVSWIQAGKARWYRRRLFVQDAPILGDLGLQNEPFGLFGADLLHDRSFVLDLSEDQIFVGPRERRR